MISIKTDIENKNWLNYIIEQFKKINLLDFNIEIISLKETNSYENVIYYSQEYKENSINIFNCGKIRPNGEIDYLKNDLFILKNTQNGIFELKYDVFWNAFVFLSRYEEFLSEKNEKNIYSYSLNHPRKDKNSFDIPIVNILFNELEKFLKEKFSNLKFKEAKKPIIHLSHDVDYIKKTMQLRIKQTLFNTFNTIKLIKKPKRFISSIIKTNQFLFSNPSYWCFDYWQELEKKLNVRSIFYVYVKDGKKDFKSWIIDPSYDIKNNKKLQNKLKELHKEGFEIGLHGSYDSANCLEKLNKEKKILEEVLSIKVIKTRQHWLNYFEQVTPYSHEELFNFDSTLGWNDRMGFRSGCASIYQPYNFEKNIAFNYNVIPQVIMDSNIYDYASETNIFKKAKDMIEKAKKTSKTTNISISWHQRVCNQDYNWHKFYEEVINDI